MLDFLRNIFCKCYKERIADLDQINFSFHNEIGKLSLKLETREEEIKVLTRPDSPAPSWLDQTETAYPPPIRYLSTTGKPYTISLKPQDIYASSKVLEDLVESEGWRTLSLNNRLKQIWYFVTTKLKYVYDYGDAWQFPATTYYRKWGDCEDGTVLFVILCKLAGVPCDRVFNACGYFKDSNTKFGHSYPVAQMEDDLWYVFETTINNKPAHPKRWKDSPYYADWGVANQTYQGKIKDGKKQI